MVTAITSSLYSLTLPGFFGHLLWVTGFVGKSNRIPDIPCINPGSNEAGIPGMLRFLVC
jgi:hypothetical protein